jgi:carbamoyl-phosphate synthase large subunit
VGYTLDEIPNDITRKTPACFEPSHRLRASSKIPRWAFEKFRGADRRRWARSMKSVGEVDGHRPHVPGGAAQGPGARSRPTRACCPSRSPSMSASPCSTRCAQPSPDRLRDIFRLLAAGDTPESIATHTGIDPWFLHQMTRIADLDRTLQGATSGRRHGCAPPSGSGSRDRHLATR